MVNHFVPELQNVDKLSGDRLRRMLAAGGTPDLMDKNLHWRFANIARQNDKRAARKVKHPAAAIVRYRHLIVAFREFVVLHRVPILAPAHPTKFAPWLHN